MATEQRYAASQIAVALSKSKRTVLQALEGAPPTGVTIVRGQQTPTWTRDAFSQTIITSFVRQAVNLGVDSEEYIAARLRLATAEPQTRQPTVPLSEIAQQSLDKAVKLQRALARILSLQNDLTRTSKELEQIGLEDYRCEFGYGISNRYLRELVKRTLDRDGGAENFSRVEIYLDEKPARKNPVRPPVSLAIETEFAELHHVLSECKNPVAPNAAEKCVIWLRAFELLEEKVASGKAAKRMKRALVQFLWRHVPTLAVNAEALRVNFQRKYDRWLKSDRDASVLADARAARSGHHRAPELPYADRKLLTAAAAKLGGGIEQAWPLLHRQLSPEIRDYYSGTWRCPTLIREAIRHDVAMEKNSLHGPNAMRTGGAHVNRDPNGIASGDWDQSDDMTMVNVWWDDAPDSPEGFWFGQGQLLVWVDERSWFAYGWNLISDPYYDGFSIRNSWNTKAASWGLPRKGLSLERGIWKTARIVVGDTVNRASAVGILETASAIKRLGLRFHNATHARVKVIERIYGKLQNYFQAAPGYVGRNPITDRYERVQEQIRLVKSGKAHPSELFLHKSQWAAILDKVLMLYNDTEMRGKYHEGRSPKQVYEAEFSDKLARIPDEFAHLFADEKFERSVTQNGAALQFGKRQFRYKGAKLGELRGQRVLIWFRPSNPEIARCTDLRGKNPFVVELEQSAFNHDPLPGTLEKALSQNAAQDRYMKELHRSLKPYYNSEFFSNLFRPVIVDREAIELSKEFSRQTIEITSRRADEKKRQTRVSKRARDLGIRPGLVENSERSQSALDLMAEARREHEREQAKEAT